MVEMVSGLTFPYNHIGDCLNCHHGSFFQYRWWQIQGSITKHGAELRESSWIDVGGIIWARWGSRSCWETPQRQVIWACGSSRTLDGQLGSWMGLTLQLHESCVFCRAPRNGIKTSPWCMSWLTGAYWSSIDAGWGRGRRGLILAQHDTPCFDDFQERPYIFWMEKEEKWMGGWGGRREVGGGYRRRGGKGNCVVIWKIKKNLER